MEQEYTMGIGWKLFYGAIAIGLFGFGLFLFLMKVNADVSPFFYILPLLIIAGSVLILINIIRRKIIIYDDRIICISLFANRELAITDIKGCRIGIRLISIEPLLPDYPTIIINNYDDFNNSDNLTKWIKENFKDLDSIDLADERDALIQDSSLGANETDRENKLKTMKGMAIAYNILGALGFGSIFIDSRFVTGALVIYPLLGILLILLSKGLIKFVSNSKRSMYGFTMFGIAFLGYMLLLKSLFKYTILAYGHLWVPAFSLAALLFVLLCFFGINCVIGSLKGQIFMMLLTALVYGFGCTREVNCEFDASQANIINSVVQSKSVEHNKGLHYHLKIKSWDDDTLPKDIEVSKITYGQYIEGTPILVYVKKGLLNIPWYYIKY